MPNEIDEFIAAYPPETREILEKVRALLRETAPGAVEALRYGIPTFVLGGKNLVHFSGYAHHIGFYPTSSGIEHFAERLSTYRTSRGAVQFPLDRPIPYDLIREITAFRVQEVEAKARSKKKS